MGKEVNPKLEIGDRIVLISMEDPFSPITIGTKGEVIGIGDDPWSEQPIYSIKWDNGRTLKLIGDEDVWIKEEKQESINESNFIDKIREVQPILDVEKENNNIFKFLKALRNSGIINMFQSPDLIWGGRETLEKYLKIQELSNSYQQIDDEDEKEELLNLAELSKSNMIRAAFIELEKRDMEPSIKNINRAIRQLSKLAFEYYMLRF